jgi:Flp pilus assembly protein TadG
MRPLALLKAFRRDSRGVSAVEFALIAPVLITTFMGLAELSQGMTVQRRVSHAASAVGDLVAQSDKITDAGITGVFKAATTILVPFSTTPLSLRVTSITGNAQGIPKVDWSDSPSGQPGLPELADGATVPTCSSTAASGCVPTGLITAAGENVILSESQYTYTAMVKYVIKNGLNFNEKFYLRPRRVAKVPRSAT